MPVAKQHTFILKNLFTRCGLKLITVYFSSKQGISILEVTPGKVKVEYNPAYFSLSKIKTEFEQLGFKILENEQEVLVEKVKQAAYELIFESFNANSLIRNSDYISLKLQMPYNKISRIFSSVTGVKLEQYIIALKIEKAKEMIMSNEYTLSEIAFLMGYNSVQYFSYQFKKEVGVTISRFKENPTDYLKPIDTLV